MEERGRIGCASGFRRALISVGVVFGTGVGLPGLAPAQTIEEFVVPTSDAYSWAIAAGPDGNLWFTEQMGNRIGRITPAGVIAEFSLPTTPYGIVAGPDGNLWFTEVFAAKIGRITPEGSITEFPVPTAGSFPQGI